MRLCEKCVGLVRELLAQAGLQPFILPDGEGVSVWQRGGFEPLVMALYAIGRGASARFPVLLADGVGDHACPVCVVRAHCDCGKRWCGYGGAVTAVQKEAFRLGLLTRPDGVTKWH